MTYYSHSRLSAFEQCKYKYKLQYINKLKVDVPATIEAFMGDLVHRTLEKLYSDLKFQKMNSKDELLRFYNYLWKKKYTSDIIIAKKEYSARNYLAMGEKFISDYYDKYYPFDQMTIISLESKEQMKLPDGNMWHVIIDKLGFKNDTYYVCDYKTNSRMKDQNEADSDRQLALYSIWVKEKFPDAKKVVLLWHMLAFNKDVVSTRTDKELKELQQEVIDKIKEIEKCREFPTNPGALCNYCVYKKICPEFLHEYELKGKPVKEFKSDEGVRLVDEFSELDEKEKEIRQKKEDIKKTLIEFASQKKIATVYGSNKKISVKPCEKIVYPEDKEEFVRLIKEKGLYENVSMLCYPKLSSMIAKKEIDKDIIDLTSVEIDYKLSISKL